MMRRSHGLAALAAGLALAAPATASEELLTQACVSCHEAGPEGLSRIAGQRKTPEGWLMTIVRMRIAHGLDITPADQSTLVAYLSETQGLAPSETEGWRYALERDPNHVEQVEEPLGTMCARCHTAARVALQRRTPEEWQLHMHFHVGQFPTIEYQALGRDREWFRLATEEIAPLLAETWPLETEAWTAWQAATKPAVTGDWVVLAQMPRGGSGYGTLSVAGDGSPYQVSGELTLSDGSTAPVTGLMNLYTGYEWRADLTVGGESLRQVLAVSEDGTGLAGRQFLAEQDSLGGRLTGVKADAGPAVLGVVPEAAAPGTASVQVVGTGLAAMQVTGATGTATANPLGASVALEGAAGDVATMAAGDATAQVTFYDTVDRLTVEPEFTIARVGGGSDVGPGAVPAQFRAIGWWNGPDGQPGTGDDIRVGEVPATWSVANLDETAEAMQDADFAGEMGEDGLFTPAVAGPNPERPFSTNNAGTLKVVAEAAGQTGEAHLIVTVQRFVDPPIR